MLISARAAVREGYKGVFRARRFWPSDADTVVEIFDSEDDPQPFDLLKLGTRSFRALENDGRIAIRRDAAPKKASEPKPGRA
jgi:hypothetical protein